MIRDLATFIDERRAGTLSQDRNGRLRYVHDADYPADATPLSPRLTVPGGEYPHSDVAPFIVGLLPDNDQLLDRWGRLFGVSPRNAFAILTHVGSDCAGAVQFVPAEAVGELDTGPLEPLAVSDIAQMLRDLRTDPYTWQQPAGHEADTSHSPMPRPSSPCIERPMVGRGHRGASNDHLRL